MALTSGDFWRTYRQNRAISGMPLTEAEFRRAEAPMLDDSYRRWVESARLGQQSRQLDIQEKQRADEARAAKMSGIYQGAGLLANTYLGYKMLTRPDPYNYPFIQKPGYTPTPGSGNAVEAAAGPGQAWAEPGAGGGGLAPSSPGAAGGGTTTVAAPAAAEAPVATTTTPSGASPADIGAGAVAGLATAYVANQLGKTEQGQDQNAQFARTSRFFGGPNMPNEGYMQSGQAGASGTAGGYVGSGYNPWGALIGFGVGSTLGAAQYGIRNKKIPGIQVAGLKVIPDIGW